MHPPRVFARRYRLDQHLGEGAFKDVWRAHDLVLGRDVALSVYHLGRDDVRQRDDLLREARALAHLGDHPGIVTVFDVGEEEGQPYLVTRLMRGGDLSTTLDAAPNRRLPPERAVAIARDVLDALAAAHAAGVIHRDVKPTNIWLDQQGRAVLGDFGIAAGGAAGHSASLATPAGTIPYMAPEQFEGKPATPQGDLYGLGSTLYELLTGQPPFTGDPSTIIAQRIAFDPPPPSRRGIELPSTIDGATMKLLARRPEDRPRSAGEAKTLLATSIVRPVVPPDERTTVRSPGQPAAAATLTIPAPPQPRAPARRSLWVAGIIAALLISGVGAAGVLLARSGDNADRVPVVSDLTIYNNVFEKQQGEFEVKGSVAACFTLAPAGPADALRVVVSQQSKPPADAFDRAVVARSDAIPQSASSSCYPAHVIDRASTLPRGSYALYVLRGAKVLARSVFFAKEPGASEPQADNSPTQAPETSPPPTPPPTPSPATPAPTPMSTPSPTPRPTWMTVSGLAQRWDCVSVRTQPETGAIINCLPNGAVVQVVEGPQSFNGRQWWRVSAGGWMVDGYFGPATGPAPASTRTAPDTVRVFYELLGDQRWPAAYQLTSSTYRRANPWPQWIDGFKTTTAVALRSMPQGTSANVLVAFMSTDTAPGGALVRCWSATWSLALEETEWRLDRAVVREESCAASAPATPIATPLPRPPAPPPAPATTAPAAQPGASGCSHLAGAAQQGQYIDLRTLQLNRLSPPTSADVVGEMTNSCPFSVCARLPSIAFYNAQGAVIAVTQGLQFSSTIVPPGQSRPFRVRSTDTPPDPVRYRLTIEERRLNPGEYCY